MFHVEHSPDEPGCLPPVIVSRETEQRLRCLEALVRRWSATVNLVARADLDRLWTRHVTDSLQALPLLQDAPGLYADLGSGGGFPGLVLAIAADRPVHLVEADHRKAAFLREAARATGADATVHATRIEQLRLPALAGCITARALAPLPALLAMARTLLAPDGVCLFLKGAGAAQEVAAASTGLRMTLRGWRSTTHPGSTLLQISAIHPV